LFVIAAYSIDRVRNVIAENGGNESDGRDQQQNDENAAEKCDFCALV
jgi:hypothetical protein